MINLSNLSNVLTIQPSANDADIKEVERVMGVVLPKVYRLLLSYANGFTVNEGLCIYGTEDLVERNDTLEVREYATGFIAIGDDGGSNVFLMSQGLDQTDVFMVDAGYMNPDGAVTITNDFVQWVNTNCTIS